MKIVVIRPNRTQRGDLLIESLIGMVLMAIIGMGVVYVTGKMSTAQRDMHLQGIAITQLRALLASNGTGTINLCDATKEKIKLAGVEVDADVQNCNANTTAVIGGSSGTTVTVPKPLIISVEHSSLGGRVVVGGTWTN